jgi:hypothetical protein
MPEDNSQLNIPRFVRAWMLATTIFLVFMVVIFVMGRLPPTPNFAPTDVYETQTWDVMEPEQRDILQSYSSYQEEVEVETAEGTTETQTVTRYTLPISVAKDLIVQRGLPVAPDTEGAADTQ